MDKIRFFFIALLGMGAAHLSAQTADSTQTSPWTTEGFAGLKLTQVSLTNWSAGGDNSVAFDLQGTYQANYKKGKHIWNNRENLSRIICESQTGSQICRRHKFGDSDILID